MPYAPPDLVTLAEPAADGRARRYQHRRAELLADAVEYILEHGIANLSLRPIAKALGVTHATLLRHFGSKEELVAEVVDHIRAGLLGQRRDAPTPVVPAPLEESMWEAWRRLGEPAERRQFVLLFELVAMNARHPGSVGPLVPMLINDFLEPIEASFRAHGLSRAEARDLATGFLAQVRGLQLDLAVSGDQRRVDAAMRRFIENSTRHLA